MSFGVIILAAGASCRMGRPKLLLPWGETSVLGHLLQQWQLLNATQIGVVCAAGMEDVPGELDRLDFPKHERIVNPSPEHGMFSSIQCAAAWTGWRADLTHWIITLGDQPHLRRQTLQALLDCSAAHLDKICQPLRDGRRRHPVLMPRPLFAALPQSITSNLKQFLEQHADKWAGFESDDAGLEIDLDTPEDYERAKRHYSEMQ